MRLPLSTVLPLFLWSTSCVKTVRPVYDSKGNQVWEIRCGGTAFTWSTCDRRASDLCGAKGYDVHKKVEEPISFGDSQGISRVMWVTCKE